MAVWVVIHGVIASPTSELPHTKQDYWGIYLPDLDLVYMYALHIVAPGFSGSERSVGCIILPKLKVRY